MKVIRTNLNIKFNRRCLNNNITPKFASININNKSVAAIKGKYIAQKTWIKEELKQLYIKKNKLNQLLYKAHLEMLNMLHPVMVNKAMDVVGTQIMNIIKTILAKHDKKFNRLYLSLIHI